MYNSMKEFLPAWTTALRSGEYKQGGQCLRSRTESFCCLGVAADLLAKAGQADWRTSEPTERDYEVVFQYEGVPSTSIGFLGIAGAPDWLNGWLHVKGPKQEVDIHPPTREALLIRLNDRGVEFPYIAKQIEEWGAGE